MIHHLVLFRWRADATPAQVAATGDNFRSMVGRVPDIRELHYGPNLAETREEWPWVLLVVLDDMAAVARYSAHPVHLDVVARNAPIREARLAVDVEV